MPLPSNLLAWTKQLVKQYNLRPGRRLGQHFLIDRQVLEQIMAAAELKPATPVLEVGGGLGALTLSLLNTTPRLTVVELDKNLAPLLQKLGLAAEHFKVISGDILKVSDKVLQQSLNLEPNDDFYIVANLPYEISGAFLRRFLSGVWRPEIMVLLLQAEVAERLVAKPGEVSLLTLQAWLAAEVKIIKKVRPSSFYPPPRVNSAIVKFKLRTVEERIALLSGLSEEYFWQVAKAGFTARRKYLISNLHRQLKFDKSKLIEIFKKLDIPLSVRAQELSLEQWAELAGGLNKE